MEQSFNQLAQQSIDDAISSLRSKNKEAAKKYFRMAVDHAKEVDQLSARRELLVACVGICGRTGILDIALEASLAVIKIDYAINDNSKDLQNDLLDYGNIQMNLGNNVKAIDTFKKALERCIEQKDFANAASCTTNLASILKNNGERKKAFEYLEQSLDHLKKKPFKETEINTLVLWLQLCKEQEVENDRIIKVGEAISKYVTYIPPQVINVIKPTLLEAIKKYMKGKPEAELKAYVSNNFVWL